MENKTVVRTNAGSLTLQIYDETILRVRFEAQESKTEYFLISQPNETIPCELTARGVKTTRFSAEVDENGRLTAYDAQGRLLVAESGRKSAPSSLAGYSAISQSFYSPADECLYGFGNVNGVIGHQG